MPSYTNYDKKYIKNIIINIEWLKFGDVGFDLPNGGWIGKF